MFPGAPGLVDAPPYPRRDGVPERAFRGLNGPELIADVLAGIRFENGAK